MARRAPETITALKRIALFRALPSSALARLAQHAAIIELPRGKQLFRRGERAAGLYTVLNGRVMLSVGAVRGAHKVIELVGPGGHIGLAAAIHEMPESVTAQTVAASSVLLVPGGALLECAASNAAFTLQLVGELGRQVSALVSEIEAFSLHTGRERVADYLRRIAAGPGPRARPVTLPAKKSIIASRLSLTPEYFSRMLHDLIAGGAIAVNGRQVTVLDATRLRESGA